MLILKRRSSRWKKLERKRFRDVFTERDPDAEPVVLKTRKATGNPNARVWGWFPVPNTRKERMFEPDTQLRDFENVHKIKGEDDLVVVIRYFHDQVEPHVTDSWADREKICSAYEINFNRHFYEFTPPRPLLEIDADIKRIEEEITRLLREVTA